MTERAFVFCHLDSAVIASRQHVQLLVADDDPGFRETLVEMLPPEFDPICVETGDEAIEVVERRDIHLALFDVHMPVLTGVEVLRLVKRLRADLPCILMSADWTQQLRWEAREARAHTLLAKPVSRTDLVTTVTLALDDPGHIWSPDDEAA
jgi:CheY-like chemotaxis protein